MSTTIDHDDAWRVAQACAWYTYNSSAQEFLAFFFNGVHHKALADRYPDDPYVEEWRQTWNTHNFSAIFGAMDYTNQRRFIAEVLRVYEADTAEALESIRAAERMQASR